MTSPHDIEGPLDSQGSLLCPVDFACSHPHYIDHAAPVWKLLPERVRGTFFITASIADHARARGIHATETSWDSCDPDRPVVILSARDQNRLPKIRRRLVFLEHGLGQTYNGRPHTVNNKRITLFLTNPCNAEALANHNTHARVVVVGPVKLDQPVQRRRRKKRLAVAFSHHWEQGVAPETQSAWPWSREAIEAVVASERYEVLGHKHPADRRNLEGWWTSLGVEFVADFCEVLARADLYVCDNSSTLYEAAAHGIPVVCLSPPWYRRDIEHNPRFWSHVPGIQVSQPVELSACIAEALSDVPERRLLRERAVETVYGPLDGSAAQRAAAALTSLASEPVTSERSYRLKARKEVVMYTSPKRVVRNGRLVAYQGEVMSEREADERGLFEPEASPLDEMTKAELLAYAADKNIEVDARANKTLIREAIDAAAK